MTYDTNRIQVSVSIESVRGTEEAQSATDQDVIWEMSGGQAGTDFAKASKGTIAQAGFQKGVSHSNQKSVTFPEMKTSLRANVDEALVPPLFKYLEAFGRTTDLTGGTAESKWIGYPTAKSLTVNMKIYEEGTLNYTGDSGRGCVGNFSLGADTPNGEIMVTVNGIMGAWNGELDGTGRFALTGNNTNPVERMENYILTFGGQAYTVQNWKDDLNGEMKPVAAQNVEGVAYYAHKNQAASVVMQILAIKPSVHDVTSDAALDAVYPEVKLAGQPGAGFDFIWTDCDVTEIPNTDADGTKAKTIKFNYQESTYKQIVVV